MINEFKLLLTLDIQFFAEGDTEPTHANPNESTPEPQAAEPTPTEPQEKLLTQAEFEEALKKRLERERKKFADYDDIKTKLTTYEQAQKERQEAEMTELEKLQAKLAEKETNEQTLAQQLAEVQKAAERERIRNEFIKVATSANIAYIDDAITLADLSAVNIDEDGKVVGVDDVVKALVENKPFLVAQKKQAQPIGTATNGGQQSNDKPAEQILEELRQKARKSGRIEDRVAYDKARKQYGK